MHCLVTGPSVVLWLEHWTPDRRAWVRCSMPPNILEVHTQYVLVKSVGSKVLWVVAAEVMENIYLLSSSIPKLWRLRLVMPPSFV
ncbi:hypothetical protein TNCV_4800021 [Trichonephila clavipes]|uniref:Uncharacterized protein n=1 Tax=Trichonephila clavipes TaxID=2585209 RepID=A0A8X6RQP0_TRICX|nr:hypothetical protein TNCV_4800021 [Trichonephila clavipes]